MPGQFAWYDLMTPDVEAAKRFYPAVTGWKTQTWKGDYTMWTTQGEALGGISPISPDQSAHGVASHWLAYVHVDDVDATAAKARQLGGSVPYGPENVPDIGPYAIIQDPYGAMVAIFKGTGPVTGWDGTPRVGRFSWHELMSTDVQGALRFYTALFGWEKTGEMDMGVAGMYAMFGHRGLPYGGIFARRPEHGDMAPNWTFYVNVPALDRQIAAVKSGRGEVIMGPIEIPGGRVAICKDPLGAMFALHEVSAPAARAASARGNATRSKSGNAPSKTSKRSKASKRTSTRKPAARKAARPARKSAKKSATKKAGARGRAPRKSSRRRGR